MGRLAHTVKNMTRRKHRTRTVIAGNSTRPRLSVHVSNRHVSAQIIDDSKHQTVAQVSTVGQKAASGTLTERAEWVGTEIAKKAKAKKVNQVVFDRGSRLYHGRIKALADAARAGGLEF
jgi:large subunit ribosomal protein L18